MREAVIAAALRSPMGRYGGILSRVRPDDLAGYLIQELLKRVPIDPKEIEDVYLGCANQAGEDNRNVARMAALIAGLPYEVSGCTVNRLCGSGLEAVNEAARAILCGEGDLFIAGGVESMSRAPWVFPKQEDGFSYGNVTAYDTALGWRFPNPKLEARFPLYSMGETAENVAEKYGISRQDQDAFALRSHQRAVKARDSVFKEEILPILVAQKKGPPIPADQDEPPRQDTSLEKLSRLSPAFRKGGSVTPGNSSGLSDGAAVILMAERSKAKSLGLKPIARWIGSAVAGVDPSLMGLGPVPATRKLLSRVGKKPEEIGLIEINEAFAAQTLACLRELKISQEKLNVNGGAIALGHPLGASGARILTTLLYEMKRRGSRLGLASLCVGVGQGISALIELLE